MRTLGILVIIVLVIVFGWFGFIMPIAIDNITSGYEEYIDRIPVSGNEEDIHISYDGVWSFTPPKCEIQNLQIQGPRGEWDDHIYFEPKITADYVKFNPIPLMTKSQIKVSEIGALKVSTKIHFITLEKMIQERNPNFAVARMGQIGKNLIEITGTLAEVQSEVILKGYFKITADGSLKFEVEEIINYINEKVTDAAKRDKVLNALDLRWQFQILGIDLEIETAAVSEMGVYIEAKSEGYKASLEK